jgi:hypothetical protein
MTTIDWSSADVVLAGQLISAAALAVHLLILRPRAARRDLLLDARIVQDELDLAERLGHVSSINPETLALQQLLRRIRQNPRSAALVLDRIPALARATQRGSQQTHVEYVGGALDRLGDAGQRYLRGAWPRAGALSAGPPDELPPENYPVEGELRSRPDIGFPTDDDEDDWDDDLDAGLDYDDDTDEPDEKDDSPDEKDEFDPDELPWPAAEDRSMAGRNLGPREVDLTDYPDDRSRRDDRNELGQRDDPAWSPAWVDLVRAESAERVSAGRAGHDRHSRPFRPARSSTRATNRPGEPVDRSSVLPR